MKKLSLLVYTIALTFVLSACGSSNPIFPAVPLSNTSDFEMPNPIRVIPDPANEQLIIINSNVDVFFEQSSILILSINGANANSPALALTDSIETPNYAGAAVFDGANLYVPFREGTDDDSELDQIFHYAITQGSISEVNNGTTSAEPFGLGLFGGQLYLVSDDVLEIFNTSLNQVDEIDLTTAEDSSIDESDSTYVENIAIDTVNSRAFLTNRDGRIFVVNLTSNRLTHVIDGPSNTRGIAYNAGTLAVVDGNSPALWIFDVSGLTNPGNAPLEIDDSQLLLKVIDLGFNPNGVTIDATNNRIYVANSGDRDISVIDLNLLIEIDRISLLDDDTGLTEGKFPFDVSVGTFGGNTFVFVANFDSNTISVINADTLKVVHSFPE